MKRAYGIFAQDGESLKFIRACSGRFARANAAALKENYLPGVFFAYFDGSLQPDGPRHKPVRLSQEPRVVKTPYTPPGRLVLDGTVKPRRERVSAVEQAADFPTRQPAGFTKEPVRLTKTGGTHR